MKAKEYLNQIGIKRMQELCYIDDRDITINSSCVFQEVDLAELMEDYAKDVAIGFGAYLLRFDTNLDLSLEELYQKFKDEQERPESWIE
jgi:hypothetical protein